MNFDLEELKKNHNTNYLASVLERLNREETEVREMLDSDESLHEMAAKELQLIQEERVRTEKQIQDILDKDKEAEEFPNEISELASTFRKSREALQDVIESWGIELE